MVDALIIQAVADALKVTIQIVESNQGFAPHVCSMRSVM